jgi:hypothetical protein
MTATQFHFAWRDPFAARRFRTAVSLHAHTMHSHESLDFLPRLARTIPLVRDAVAYEERRYERKNGHPIDYSSSYWTPPLPEMAVLAAERRQIEDSLDASALVSITDHDSVEAPMHLHLMEASQDVPVSEEWTVPFGPSFFHLGVHNLPRGEARSWMASLASYTRQPSPALLRDLLAALSDQREALVILNHPLWDEAGIGPARHRQMLDGFIGGFGEWLHAFELNGTRSWQENQQVIELARGYGRLVISGGDRHGSQPNTVVNLTNTASFEEFVDEVRRERVSDVLILPQYRESHCSRYAEMVWDIIREYPEYAGRTHWTDRFFCRNKSGEFVTLANVWQDKETPWVVGFSTFVVRLMGSRRIRSTIRLAMRASGEALP